MRNERVKNDKEYRKSQMTLCDIQMFVGVTFGVIFIVCYPFYYDVQLSDLAKKLVFILFMLLFISLATNRSMLYTIKYCFAMYFRGFNIICLRLKEYFNRK